MEATIHSTTTLIASSERQMFVLTHHSVSIMNILSSVAIAIERR